MNWRDKKGYTLVEMIIAMAVMSVIGLAVALLMKHGTSSFSLAKSELDLQMESQTLMAQMSSMIQEANYAEFDPAHKVLVLYQTEEKHLPGPTGSAPGKNIVVSKTVKDMKMINFSDTNHQLYLDKYDHEVLKPASGGSVSYSDDKLFAEFIEDFSAVVEGNKVTVSLKMKSGKRTYSVDVTTKIRNKIVNPQ